MDPCEYSTVTLSTVITSRPARLKGFSVVIKQESSGATVCIIDSGVSVPAAYMWASTTGTTIVYGPRRIDASPDNLAHVNLPAGGVRCKNGIWAYFPKLSGSTLHVYWD